MSNPLDPMSPPAAVKRVATLLRTAGWVAFWMQLVLGVISGLILLFALPFAIPKEGGVSGAANPGTGGGLLFAFLGLLALALSVYWCFRYVLLARKLRNPDTINRPSRADTIKWLRVGLITNLVGLFLNILGAETISGNLLAKSLAQPFGLVSTAISIQNLIQPLDIFVVLANTHAIFAHFIGLVAGMWLLDTINRQ